MERLSEKENALLMLKHSPDVQYVPIDPIDIVFMSPVREKAPMFQDGSDWFGCPWHWDAMTFGHAPDLKQPYRLKDICSWRDELEFPDLAGIDWQAAAEADTARCNRDEKLSELFFEMGIFERTNTLFGFENAFVAMMEEPDEYKALLRALMDYKLDILGHVLPAYKPDMTMWHDDLGTANGPMISVDAYREFLKPLHAEMVDYVHSQGVLVNYHSCGLMAPFIPDLIDIDVDMINPLQDINDWDMVAREYGDAMCFNVDCGPRGDLAGTTPEQLVADVHRCIDTFAPYRGFFPGHFPSNMAVAETNMPIIVGEIARYGAVCYQDAAA